MALYEPTAFRPTGQEVWGRALNPIGLKELFKGNGAPKKHVRGVHPPAGIDHMRLRTTDVFRIPGMGEFEVKFSGYFKVIRSDPDHAEFTKATVYVNFLELKLFGSNEQLGDMMVDLNPHVRSAGNTFPSRDGAAAACRINVAARFHIERLQKTFFNKTPIQLKNDDVKGIPTIGEGGQAPVNSLPVYDWEEPNGDLFGFVEELNYMVLDYATGDEVDVFKSARSLSELRVMSDLKKVRLD